MNKRGYSLLAIVSLVVLAISLYVVLSRGGATESTPHASDHHALEAATVPSWVCPMHEQIIQDHAGDCPICGMHLVAATVDAGEHENENEHHEPDFSETEIDSKESAASWICPMHAQIQQGHPGRCPICGMDLVRNASAAAAHHDGGVTVDSVLQQRLGVRLAPVEQREIRREIRSWGTVVLDPSARFEISPKVDGWLRKLHVVAVGETVRAGQPLYELYSPDLVQRQREFIELLRRSDQLQAAVGMPVGQNAQMLASLARERLRNRRLFENIDLDKAFIDRLEKYRRPIDAVVIRAARGGVVTAIGAREGSYITPQVNLFSMAELSKVWIDIALYLDQLAWVSSGDVATATTQDGLRTQVSGRLQLPNPLLDRASQTLRARMVLDAAGRQLRPGAYVDVRIATPARQVLALPRSALIRSGSGERVMLARGDGRFLPTTVQIGIEDEDYVEIISGVAEGDQVAVKGQFLLDAAASLQAASQRMRDDH